MTTNRLMGLVVMIVVALPCLAGCGEKPAPVATAIPAAPVASPGAAAAPSGGVVDPRGAVTQPPPGVVPPGMKYKPYSAPLQR